MSQRLPVVLSAAALVVAVLGATPYAEAHGVIHALFAHNAGKVDGVSASRTPRAGKLLPLGGNGKFPASVVPPGPAGPEGPQGPTGPNGLNGLDGQDGAEGPIGPQGLPGADGADGAQGPPGADGAEGPQGPQGPQGLQGAQGLPGTDGADGADGTDGAPGADGAPGPQGQQGPQGPVGPRGPSNAYWAADDGPSPALTTTPTAIESMTLPAGTYVIWAKAWFANTGTAANVTCNLSAGALLDSNQLPVSGSSVMSSTFVGIRTLASPTATSLSCQVSAGLAVVTASYVKIVAIEVETLTGL